jgi:hypothetical protein
MTVPRLIAAFTCAVSLLLSSVASAEDPDRVEWSPDWQRVHPRQVTGMVALTLTDVGIEVWVPTPTHAHFRGAKFFDNWVHAALKGRSESANTEKCS